MVKQDSLAYYEMPPEFYATHKVLDYPPDKNHTYLDPCPKCSAVLEVSGHMAGNNHRIECCRCWFTTPWYPTFTEAIDKWNNSQYTHRMRKPKKDKNA
jgi:hypothetical protein